MTGEVEEKEAMIKMIVRAKVKVKRGTAMGRKCEGRT